MRRKKKPEEMKINTISDIGIEITHPECKLSRICCYSEGNSILFWATVIGFDENEHEGLQYFTPNQAMKLAKSLEACAIEALKNGG